MALQIVQQDFLYNYMNAVGSEDEVLSTKLLADELSDLVNNYPNLVVKAFKDSKVDIKTPASTITIVDTLVKNLATNKELLTRISYLIAVNNNAMKGDNMSEHFNVTGKEFFDSLFKTGSGAAGGAAAGGPVGAIAGSIAGLTQSALGLAQSKNERETKEAELKAEMFKNLQAGKGGIGTGAIIAIVGTMALVIGSVIYFATRTHKVVTA